LSREARRALPDEGATRAGDRLFFEGEPRPALLAEGATQALLIGKTVKFTMAFAGIIRRPIKVEDLYFGGTLDT
jgi:hypothetical protein